MRMSHRNMQTFYYCQSSLEDSAVAEGSEAYIIDEHGNMTSELLPQYSEAVEMKANISPATGNSQMDTFGQLDNYDKVIVTSWMDCPITEKTVLFIDKEPEYDDITVTVITDDEPQTATVISDDEPQTATVISDDEPQTVTVVSDDEPQTVTVHVPKYNYIVRRVAKSLHYIAYAVQKVR